MDSIESRQFWSKEARQWKWHGKIDSEVTTCIKGKVESYLADLSDDALILDLGSGSGGVLYFPEHQRSRVIALDSAVGMLQESMTQIKVLASVNAALPIRAETINAVTSFFLMRYLTNVEANKMAQEVQRVLSPNGKFFVFDLRSNHFPYQEGEFLSQEYARTLLELGFQDVRFGSQTLTFAGPDRPGYRHLKVTAEIEFLTARKS